MAVASPVDRERLETETDEVRDESSKSSRRGNIFMRKLEPEMLID
jgi:hypothetical protein